MKFQLLLLLLLACVMSTNIADAGIPEPGMVFYGSVTIVDEDTGESQVQTAGSDIEILARIESHPDTLVGLYQMGSNINAKDNYVQRVRMESLTDGSEQSINAALMDQNIEFYIKQPDNIIHYAGSYPITERGKVLNIDLISTGSIYYGSNINFDNIIDLLDFAKLASQWARIDCNELNNFCNGADIDHQNGVDIQDLIQLAEDWLAE